MQALMYPRTYLRIFRRSLIWFLLKSFRKAFDEEAAATGKPTLLLSASLSKEKNDIYRLYDVPKLAKWVRPLADPYA